MVFFDIDRPAAAHLLTTRQAWYAAWVVLLVAGLLVLFVWAIPGVIVGMATVRRGSRTAFLATAAGYVVGVAILAFV